MRFYPKDQGLSAFLSELAAMRAQKVSATPTPIESAGGGVAGGRDSTHPPAIPNEKFSAPQQRFCPRCNKPISDYPWGIHTCSPQL